MTDTPTTDPGRLRADARRNRQKVLAAATRAFCDDGVDIAMEEIARRAGVGVGTLYRRFPNREALVLAIVQETFAELLERADTISASSGTAWDRLTRALHAGVEFTVVGQILRRLPPDTMARIMGDPSVRQARADLLARTTSLLVEAQHDGAVRTDIGTEELVFLFTMLDQARATATRSPAAAEKAYTVILDGLRAEPAGPVPR